MTGSASSPTNPYQNPELCRFVGSMEGVPDWIDPAETAELDIGEVTRAGQALHQCIGHVFRHALDIAGSVTIRLQKRPCI